MAALKYGSLDPAHFIRHDISTVLVAVAALQGVNLVGKDKDGWVDFTCPEHGKFRIRPSGNSAVFCPHCPPEVVWAAIMAHEAQHRTHKEMGEPYPDAPAGDEP